MRARHPPGHRHHGGKSSLTKLLAIGAFSIGLLGGYMFISSPRSVDKNYRRSLVVSQRGDVQQVAATTSRASTIQQKLGGAKVQLEVLRNGAPLSLMQQVAAPQQQLSKDDPRNPSNVQVMIKEASHHEEHKADAMEALKRGQSAEAVAATASPPPSQTAAASTTTTTSAGGAASGAASGTSTTPPGSKHDAGNTTAAGATPVAAAAGKQGAGPVGSSVASTAAALQKGAQKLKEATKVLEQKKAELDKAAAQAADTTKDSKQEATAAAAPAPAKAKESTTTSKGGRPYVAQPRGDTLMEKVFAEKRLGPGDTIHTFFTSNGSPYQNIQARIMVATYRLMQKMPGGEKHVAMTRILHRTTPDEVMEEIPTFRANPLQPECDKWCWFPVADRANAWQQFLDAADKDPSLIKAPWLLLLETDYVWVKPLQAPGDAYDMKVPGLSFAFDYIAPRHPIVAEILKLYCPTCDPNSVPASGPAPVLARFSDFKAATPLWEDLSLWIETHEHAKKALGWVREMYAWDIGVAANKLNIQNVGKPHTTLISQPPHDDGLYNATMYHYTWGSIYKNAAGNETWKFDKRFYVDPKDALKVPKLPVPPTWVEGTKLQDGMVVSKQLDDTLRDMIVTMNRGIDTLPDLSAKAKPA